MTTAPAAPEVAAPGVAAAELTDEQVVEVVRSLVRLHLEIERGLRPPQPLAPYLSPEAHRQLDLHPRTTFPHGGPVHPRDIGPPRLSRYPGGRIHASVTAREQHDRWSGIVVRLGPGGDRRLAVSGLQRVPQRPQARQLEPSPRPDLRHLRSQVEQERQIVEAAHLAESARSSSAYGHERRLAELDRELADLRKRMDHRDEVAATKHTLEAPPRYVTKLLGHPPAHHTWRRLQWDSARTAIEEYRQRFDIYGATALGPTPTQKQQHEARAEVVCLVRAVQRSMQHRDHQIAVGLPFERGSSR